MERPHLDTLPEHIEGVVLAILDGPRHEQERRLDALAAAQPAHRERIEEWVAVARQTTTPLVTTTSPLPSHIGGYRVLERLGRGGQGEVYLAEHERLGRHVALKLIRGDLVDLPEARARFLTEAQVASRLDHPGICHVYEVGEQDGRPFLAMQWIRGSTLAEIIRRRREQDLAGAGAAGTSTHARHRATIDAAVALVEKVAQALHVAHEAGLVHRDIKPSNIMVRDDDTPVLVDFGLARELRQGDASGVTKDLLGTPLYMAPEQIEPRGRRIDARTDVYALGVTLYELLLLQPPYGGDSRTDLFAAILHGNYVAARRRNRAIPRDLDLVIDIALDRDQERRYPSAAAFAADLRRVLLREPILTRRASAVRRTWRWLKLHPVRNLAAVLLCALAGVVSYFVLRERERDRVQTAQAARRDGNDAARSGAFDGALRFYQRALDLGIADSLAVRLARIEVLEAAMRGREAAAEIAHLATLPDLGRHAARVQLRLGQERMTLDPAEGRHLMHGALALAETAHAELLPVEQEYAKAWVADDLALIAEHLDAAAEYDIRHLPSALLRWPVLFWQGRPADVLTHVDRAQAWLPPTVDLLPRLLALAILDRGTQCRALMASRGGEFGDDVRPAIDFVLAVFAYMHETLGRQSENLVASYTSLPGRPFGVMDTFKTIRLIGQAKESIDDPTKLRDTIQTKLGVRVHPHLLASYKPLLGDWQLLKALTDPASARPILERAVAAFPDSMLLTLLVLVELRDAGRTPEGYRAAILRLDQADAGLGIAAAMPALGRLRSALRVGVLMSWVGALPADDAARPDLTQQLAFAIDQALTWPGLSETELWGYAVVASHCKGPRWSSLPEKVLVTWERLHGATDNLCLVRADWWLHLGAKASAIALLDDILTREPNHPSAKALRERAR